MSHIWQATLKPDGTPLKHKRLHHQDPFHLESAGELHQVQGNPVRSL